MADLSPMGRLMILAGLASPSSSSVHFVEADRASFLYRPSKQMKKSDSSNGVTSGGGIRGVAHTDSDVLSNGDPPSGQVGVLSFDPSRRGGEFVVDVNQSLPERLSVSAHRPGDGMSSSPLSGLNGDESGVRYRESSYNGDVSTPVCVKYLDTVGFVAIQREDWFPSRDDALSLRRAVDAYCPVSWLRDGCREGADAKTEVDVVGEEDGNGVGCGKRQRRFLMYQRDLNRRIVYADKVRSFYCMISFGIHCQREEGIRLPLQLADLRVTAMVHACINRKP